MRHESLSESELDDETIARLGRYATGTASAEEALAVERWIAAEPGRREVVEQMAAVWQRSSERPNAIGAAEFDVERARLAVKQKIRWRRPKPSPWSQFAAAAAVVLLAAGGWWMAHPPRAGAGDRPEWIAEHHTGRGELRTVVLGDGTRVTLAPGSALRQARFGRTRDVDLTGKAYFQVTHDPAHPFVVHAGPVETRVLGTTFSVTARPGEPGEVVLRSGRVAVTATSAKKITRAILDPGQRAIGTADGSLELGDTDVARELAWTNGQLAFAGAPLADVVRELGHWYGLSVAVTDSSLSHRRVTGAFPLDSSTTVIRALAALVDARVVQRGDSILLERRSRL